MKNRIGENEKLEKESVEHSRVAISDQIFDYRNYLFYCVIYYRASISSIQTQFRRIVSMHYPCINVARFDGVQIFMKIWMEMTKQSRFWKNSLEMEGANEIQEFQLLFVHYSSRFRRFPQCFLFDSLY